MRPRQTGPTGVGTMSRLDAPRIVAASRKFISQIQQFDHQYDAPGYNRHRVQVLITLTAQELNLALEGRTLFGPATIPAGSVCDYRSEIQCNVIRECLRQLLARTGRLLTDLHQIITRLDVMLVWLGVAPCRVCRVLSDRPLVPLGVPSRSRRRRVSGPRTGPASFDAATCTAPSPRSETYGWSAPHDCWSVLAG